MNERTMPGGSGDERSLLDGWLDYYRATLLAKCEGLTGEQLVARSCEPSPMSLIGLVRHMTEMERMYGHRLADWGTGLLYCTDEDEDADFAAVPPPVRQKTWRHSARTAPGPGKSWRLANSATPWRNGSRTLRWFYLYLIKSTPATYATPTCCANASRG